MTWAAPSGWINAGGRWLAPGTAAFDGAWQEIQIGKAPHQWQPRIKRVWASMFEGQGESAANVWLRETAESLHSLLLPLDASDADLRQRAGELAQECMRTAGDVSSGLGSFAEAAARFCEARGIEPPSFKDGEEHQIRAAVARMTCPIWWRRRLRVAHGRKIERHAVELGYVHLKREKYVSDVNVLRRQQQKRRNAEALANVVATNQHGDSFTLAELAERSNANPRIRRAELMTRVAGFEEIARGMGHAAEFWTGTCPSRFHATIAATGRPNKWHDGSTARDAQGHLCKAWAKCRAALHRMGVRVYGFRIAEPHHDSCPHWHLLLFMPVAVVEAARAKFKKYFLDQHEPNEPGAQDNRVKFVSVQMTDTKSAAGYVIKYISKNIDGYQAQQDLYGGCAVEGAARVDAWASTHGIRQFQQIGGAPVGVWRELRRMDAGSAENAPIEPAISAADSGDWAGYIREQGGPVVARKDLELGLQKSPVGQRFDPVTEAHEPAPTTRYGECAVGKVFGVVAFAKCRAFVSRRFKWDVAPVRRAVRVEAGGKAARPWTRVNNCTGVEGVGTGGRVAERAQGSGESRPRQGAGVRPAAFGGIGGADPGTGRPNH